MVECWLQKVQNNWRPYYTNVTEENLNAAINWREILLIPTAIPLILASLTFGTGVIFHEDKRPILLNKEIRKQKESQIHKENRIGGYG